MAKYNDLLKQYYATIAEKGAQAIRAIERLRPKIRISKLKFETWKLIHWNCCGL